MFAIPDSLCFLNGDFLALRDADVIGAVGPLSNLGRRFATARQRHEQAGRQRGNRHHAG